MQPIDAMNPTANTAGLQHINEASLVMDTAANVISHLPESVKSPEATNGDRRPFLGPPPSPRFAMLPLIAIMDPALSKAELRLFALLQQRSRKADDPFVFVPVHLSQGWIAEQLGYACENDEQRTRAAARIGRAAAKLERAGYLRVMHKMGRGRRGWCGYDVNPAWVKETIRATLAAEGVDELQPQLSLNEAALSSQNGRTIEEEVLPIREDIRAESPPDSGGAKTYEKSIQTKKTGQTRGLVGRSSSHTALREGNPDQDPERTTATLTPIPAGAEWTCAALTQAGVPREMAITTATEAMQVFSSQALEELAAKWLEKYAGTARSPGGSWRGFFDKALALELATPSGNGGRVSRDRQGFPRRYNASPPEAYGPSGKVSWATMKVEDPQPVGVVGPHPEELKLREIEAHEAWLKKEAEIVARQAAAQVAPPDPPAAPTPPEPVVVLSWDESIRAGQRPKEQSAEDEKRWCDERKAHLLAGLSMHEAAKQAAMGMQLAVSA